MSSFVRRYIEYNDPYLQRFFLQNQDGDSALFSISYRKKKVNQNIFRLGKKKGGILEGGHFILYLWSPKVSFITVLS